MSGNKLSNIIRLFLFILSVVVIGAVVTDYGFPLNEHESGIISGIYDVAWWCYLLMFTLWLIFGKVHTGKVKMSSNWILGLMLYLSLFTKIFEIQDTHHWIYPIWNFLSGKYYNVAILLIFALLEVSRGVVNFMDKRTNPTLMLASGFLLIIFVGTILLLLPRSTHEHIVLSVTDALFISTSAVCVTGLTPIDIASVFTQSGEMIILVLIQIGGLGVMTITSFFALFFMGAPGLHNQFALKDMVGSETFGSLLSTLGYILGFTFLIEGIGAIFIWWSIHSTMGMALSDEMFFAIFHSVSAFCNAGFSTLEGNLGNTTIISGHNSFFVIISFLVILGGIGYPILVNLVKLALYHVTRICNILLRSGKGVRRYTHILNLNTKLVLVTTIVLLVAGSILIAVMEWNNGFATMPFADKIVHSFFNSTVPRTAGFTGVDLVDFSTVSIIIYILLMWIGGASQSTAGGIKVNTIAVSAANFISIIRGMGAAVAFNREIAPESVRRASATILGSMMAIAASFVLLVFMEPEIEPEKLFFETVSAFSTVGASLDTTPLLGEMSKLLLSLVMFMGRVGFITLLMGIVQQKEQPKYRYLKDMVIIN